MGLRRSRVGVRRWAGRRLARCRPSRLGAHAPQLMLLPGLCPYRKIRITLGSHQTRSPCQPPLLLNCRQAPPGRSTVMLKIQRHGVELAGSDPRPNVAACSPWAPVAVAQRCSNKRGHLKCLAKEPPSSNVFLRGAHSLSILGRRNSMSGPGFSCERPERDSGQELGAEVSKGHTRRETGPESHGSFVSRTH